MVRDLLIAASLMIAVPAAGWAQKPGPASGSVAERREQLARDMEGMADGDPLTRVATMEAILRRGDAGASYIVMRSAFASDDPALRNLALRAWFADAKRLNLSIVLPPDLQKQADEALYDTKQASELFKNNRWLRDWSSRGLQLAVAFAEVDPSKGTGKIWSLPSFTQQNASDFTIAGNQVFASIDVAFAGIGAASCHISLTPSHLLVFEGTVACDFGDTPSPPLKITAPMF